jgi:hypothetical protein
MVAEDVYNMGETSLFNVPNQTRHSTRKSSWAQNSEGPSHSCSCCKHDKHSQVEIYDYLQISMPKMLWKVIANNFICGGLQIQWHG